MIFNKLQRSSGVLFEEQWLSSSSPAMWTIVTHCTADVGLHVSFVIIPAEVSCGSEFPLLVQNLSECGFLVLKLLFTFFSTLVSISSSFVVPQFTSSDMRYEEQALIEACCPAV